MSIQTIPLSKLMPSALNVRKTGATQGLAELAASIKANGLLQNLTVVEAGGFFEVVAGGRRLAALNSLLGDGEIPSDFPVPCMVTTTGAAVEASTAENVVRAPMHPADEYLAFKALADQDLSVAEIAARFGCPELLVKQRLKLANVSPKLLELYQKGEATLAQMQALALVDDHQAQEEAWFGFKQDWQRTEWALRDRLLKTAVRADDARVRFVGLEAYIAAGGAVNEDLFGRNTTVADVKLLDRLVEERLSSAVEEVRSEGWAWVEARVSFDHAEQASWKVAGYPQKRMPTPEESAKIEAVQSRIRELEDIDEEEFTAEHGEELDRLHEEDGALNEALMEYPIGLKASSGAVVTPDGVHRARMRPGEKLAKAVPVAGHTRSAPGKGDKKPGDLSFAAIQRLQAEATAALRWEVATLPSVALALLIDRLAVPRLYDNRHDLRRWLKIDADGTGRMPPDLAKVMSETAADAELEKIHAGWKFKLPKRYDDLLPHLLREDVGTLTKLLAYLVACEIDAVDFVPQKEGSPVRLARAIGVDLTKHWEPTEAWIATLPKPVVMALVTDAAGKTAAAKLEKLKKDQLPAAALPLFPKGWVPKPLRGPKKEAPAKKAHAARGKSAAAGGDE